MLRQWPARRLAALERLHRDLGVRGRVHRHLRRSLGLGGIFLHVGKLKLELIQVAAVALSWWVSLSLQKSKK